ncbi:uncharacterized protein BDR25DRAFT_352060 [Lindgomyces ingoldianus]|uniref:Uncharacterized protein n=1 Tax=Lindgomyces ingoldianus TaxID=673940 RepID=A0ACB6R318_9PLEO|nr:uncharacterized protein BDR25DRAFT_352060 [Lindgomyces ingoldianus]KAF2473566.1 hypothetical protein BDR25DRAFT_352060 [Lindgomyces ingoldianus]
MHALAGETKDEFSLIMSFQNHQNRHAEPDLRIISVNLCILSHSTIFNHLFRSAVVDRAPYVRSRGTVTGSSFDARVTTVRDCGSNEEEGNAKGRENHFQEMKGIDRSLLVGSLDAVKAKYISSAPHPVAPISTPNIRRLGHVPRSTCRVSHSDTRHVVLFPFSWDQGTLNDPNTLSPACFGYRLAWFGSDSLVGESLIRFRPMCLRNGISHNTTILSFDEALGIVTRIGLQDYLYFFGRNRGGITWDFLPTGPGLFVTHAFHFRPQTRLLCLVSSDNIIFRKELGQNRAFAQPALTISSGRLSSQRPFRRGGFSSMWLCPHFRNITASLHSEFQTTSPRSFERDPYFPSARFTTVHVQTKQRKLNWWLVCVFQFAHSIIALSRWMIIPPKMGMIRFLIHFKRQILAHVSATLLAPIPLFEESAKRDKMMQILIYLCIPVAAVGDFALANLVHKAMCLSYLMQASPAEHIAPSDIFAGMKHHPHLSALIRKFRCWRIPVHSLTYVL